MITNRSFSRYPGLEATAYGRGTVELFFAAGRLDMRLHFAFESFFIVQAAVLINSIQLSCDSVSVFTLQ